MSSHGAVGHDERALHDGSTASTAALEVGHAAVPPGCASHTNVSRLPFGPGSPLDANPSTTAPSAEAARATSSSASRRSAGVAHDAVLPDPPRPHLELRLDHHQRVERRREAAEHRRQHLRHRDERHVDDGQVGDERKVGRRAAPGR